MNWERIEPWDYVVIAVASEYHKKYTMVELDDIKQSLYQWFVEHPRKLNEWEAIGPKDAKNLIYRSLRNQALDYCQKWKAKSLGYEVSDLFYYDPEVIENLLPAVLLGYDADAPKLNLGMPGKPPAPAEGGNLMAMLVEVDLAYHKLSTEDRTVLFHKYAESMDYGSIATAMELGSDDAARMRHNRAIKKLINRIGGFKPFSDGDSNVEPSKDTNDSAESVDPEEQNNDRDDTEFAELT